jgi:hypothetical protein
MSFLPNETRPFQAETRLDQGPCDGGHRLRVNSRKAFAFALQGRFCNPQTRPAPLAIFRTNSYKVLPVRGFMGRDLPPETSLSLIVEFAQPFEGANKCERAVLLRCR